MDDDHGSRLGGNRIQLDVADVALDILPNNLDERTWDYLSAPPTGWDAPWGQGMRGDMWDAPGGGRVDIFLS